jgi:hypothetical protein
VSYSLGAAAAALRQMSQARHVGKVVVSNSQPSQPCYAVGRVLVTGGLGALGTLVAQWLAGNSVRQLHLLGRSGKLQAGSGIEQLLSNSCSQVIVSQCDAGFSEDLAAVLRSSSQLLPVEVIVHAGGVLADATLQQQKLRSVRQASAAKLSPVAAFNIVSQQQPVRSIVHFSSVASLLGSPGQANYAAANAGLDAAAGAAQLSGIPAVSVQWGAWAGGGMAAADAQTAARVERMGMSLISPAAGLAALEAALSSITATPSAAPQAAATVAAIPFNWPTFMARQQGGPAASFLSEFAGAAAAVPVSAAGRPTRRRRTAAAQGPRGAAAAASSEALQAQVSDAVATILGRGVASDEPLVAAGLDSLGSVELRNSLQVCGTLFGSKVGMH